MLVKIQFLTKEGRVMTEDVFPADQPISHSPAGPHGIALGGGRVLTRYTWTPSVLRASVFDPSVLERPALLTHEFDSSMTCNYCGVVESKEATEHHACPARKRPEGSR